VRTHIQAWASEHEHSSARYTLPMPSSACACPRGPHPHAHACMALVAFPFPRLCLHMPAHGCMISSTPSCTLISALKPSCILVCPCTCLCALICAFTCPHDACAPSVVPSHLPAPLSAPAHPRTYLHHCCASSTSCPHHPPHVSGLHLLCLHALHAPSSMSCVWVLHCSLASSEAHLPSQIIQSTTSGTSFVHGLIVHQVTFICLDIGMTGIFGILSWEKVYCRVPAPGEYGLSICI